MMISVETLMAIYLPQITLQTALKPLTSVAFWCSRLPRKQRCYYTLFQLQLLTKCLEMESLYRWDVLENALDK